MISFIIATLGRPSLVETLASIELWDGDEVIVIGNVDTRTDGPIRYLATPPGGDWGSTERNIATPLACGRFLAHIDDDDTYAPGHRALMADAMTRNPHVPTIFRMQYQDGGQLWIDPIIRWGNVGTPMFLTPNVPAKLGRWGEKMDCGDLRFLQSMAWRNHEIAWRDEVIAHVGQVHP